MTYSPRGVAMLVGSGGVGLLLLLASCADDYDTGEEIATVAAAAQAASFAGGQDWPQWRGAGRNGVSQETGLMRQWSADGPIEMWRRPIGSGYSATVVKGQVLYTLEQTDSQYLVAVDATSGDDRWRVEIEGGYQDGQGDGPRGAPAVTDSAVVAVASRGTLVALHPDDGRLLWRRDLVSEFSGSAPYWGYSTSAAIVGDSVLVQPGGPKNGAAAAFRVSDGELLWSSFDDGAGYSSPIVVDVGGRAQAIFFTGGHLIGVLPEDGEILWRVPWETSYQVNAATPVWIEPDRVFISSNYDVGGAVYQLQPQGVPRRVWKNREMRNHFNTSVYLNGHLYGFDNSTLKCVDAGTGERCWRQRGLGRGSLIAADGMLIVLGERGQLVLAEATASSYVELARAQVLKGKCWTSPTLSHGKLFLRNQKELVCLEMRKPPGIAPQS